MISSQNLQFSYQQNQLFSFPDFNCQQEETLLVLGNSGKGKTTFLHLLALILPVKSGQIIIDGKDVSKLSPEAAAKERAKNIGIIYQRPHFVSALSVQDNLLLANYLASKKLDKQKLKYLAEALGFESLLNKKTHELSIGEQQRVGIARALMNDPNVILADEPTSSLDDYNCEKVISLLNQQASVAKAAMVVVTHDQRLKNHFSNQISL